MNAFSRTEGLHFSVSQMKAWLMCPRKYEYRYVTSADPEFVPMPLAFGSAFHSALAYHYGWLMRGEPAPAAEVRQRFVDEGHGGKVAGGEGQEARQKFSELNHRDTKTRSTERFEIGFLRVSVSLWFNPGSGRNWRVLPAWVV